MDSAALLDLLGNENRRRILRLLARKPCYVTEISDYLGVSPKAVIDHLRKLEDAGLVESRIDDGRRKYFHIARNLRLEVTVSPYGFGAKSAYPASSSLDTATWRHLSIELSAEEPVDPVDLARELGELRTLENELSMAQRWVQGQVTGTLDELLASLETTVDTRLCAELLVALDAEPRSTRELAERVDAPPELIEDALTDLRAQGLVRRVGDGWRLAD